jgi:hypothetical protein
MKQSHSYDAQLFLSSSTLFIEYECLLVFIRVYYSTQPITKFKNLHSHSSAFLKKIHFNLFLQWILQTVTVTLRRSNRYVMQLQKVCSIGEMCGVLHSRNPFPKTKHWGRNTVLGRINNTANRTEGNSTKCNSAWSTVHLRRLASQTEKNTISGSCG